MCHSAFLAADRWFPLAQLQSRCQEERQSQRQCDLPFDLQTLHRSSDLSTNPRPGEKKFKKEINHKPPLS